VNRSWPVVLRVADAVSAASTARLTTDIVISQIADAKTAQALG